MFNLKLTKKKRWKYSIEKQENENLKLCTYGIKEKDTGELLEDVSYDRHKVRKIVRQLNRYQASPIHLKEITEDLIK